MGDPLPGMPTPTPRPRPSLADYPARIRVYGGRNTHAARTELARPGSAREWTHRTACDRVSDAGSASRLRDHLLDPDTPVTCKACTNALTPKEPTP